LTFAGVRIFDVAQGIGSGCFCRFGLMESAERVANPEITVLEALTDGLLVTRPASGPVYSFSAPVSA
jgi:hypothetical protein